MLGHELGKCFFFQLPVPWCQIVAEASGHHLVQFFWPNPQEHRGLPGGRGATLGRPLRHCRVSIQRPALPSAAALQPLETMETSRPRRPCRSRRQLAMRHWHQLPSRLLLEFLGIPRGSRNNDLFNQCKFETKCHIL